MTKHFRLFACLFFCIPVVTTATTSLAREKPNVLIIIPDDLGWMDVSYHGSDVETPTLDRLASQGVKLEQHYVYPTCSPTRVGLLSGRAPSRYGVYSPIGGKSTKHLPPETTTLADVFAAQGYTTHLSGKWHLGLQTQWGPRQYGFQTTYGYLHGQIDPYNHLYKFGDKTWHRNDKLFDEEGHATDLLTDEAIRVVQQSGEKPFFLYLAYSVPHHPLKEPQKWLSHYEGKIENPSRRLFAASVTHMDAEIGRLMKAIEASGKKDNTLVLFVSDNGGQSSWGAPKTQYEGRYEPNPVLGNNRPLRGWKTEMFEGGIRVPAFAYWPGKLSAGKTVNEPTHVLDWMTTLASLIGYESSQDLQWEGKNIWSLLDGSASSLGERTFYWATPRKRNLRSGDWKLITDAKGNKPQLFNIAKDPYEKTDLATEQVKIVEDLRKKLLAETEKDK